VRGGAVFSVFGNSAVLFAVTVADAPWHICAAVSFAVAEAVLFANTEAVLCRRNTHSQL